MASGVLLPSVGQHTFECQSGERASKKITAQVSDVNKAFLSVSKVANNWSRVVLEETGSYIQNAATGENM